MNELVSEGMYEGRKEGRNEGGLHYKPSGFLEVPSPTFFLLSFVLLFTEDK